MFLSLVLSYECLTKIFLVFVIEDFFVKCIKEWLFLHSRPLQFGLFPFSSLAFIMQLPI